MKKLNALNLSVLFAGCFLGAGYVSGQELWQFFGSFGKNGLLGLIAAILILGIFGFLILRLPALTGESRMEFLIIPWNISWLRWLARILEIIFLFGIVAIMSAGTGALFHQLFDFPVFLGNLVFCLFVLALAFRGLRGLVSVFSFSVPILVAATLLIGLILCQKAQPVFQPIEEHNVLLGNWPISAVLFACCNIFGTIGILTPFGTQIPRIRTLLVGLLLGAAWIFLIALSILLTLFRYPKAAAEELPMLALAEQLGFVFILIYAILLTIAMFGTALSGFMGFCDIIEKCFPKAVSRGSLLKILTIALAYLSSLFGFGDLIGTLYPIFGYSSILFLICMSLNYASCVRKKRSH